MMQDKAKKPRDKKGDTKTKKEQLLEPTQHRRRRPSPSLSQQQRRQKKPQEHGGKQPKHTHSHHSLGINIHLNNTHGSQFIEAVKKKRFLFALVTSFTKTSQIPGITAAGASPQMIELTPPADAEFLHYGSCMCIDKVPMTPDGKPTPALLSKTALESASIPHVVVNAGSKVSPKIPYIATGLSYGKNVSDEPAQSYENVVHAVDFGRIAGRTLATLTDCLVIGESLPGGTTTAFCVLKALGYHNTRVSSSMTQNPIALKNSVYKKAMKRLVAGDAHARGGNNSNNNSNSNNKTYEPFSVIANMGDPMIPFIAGMLSTASQISHVILAGGTQMAAVLAFAKTLGYNSKRVVLGTTSYVIHDPTANLVDIIKQIDDTVSILSVDPQLSKSKITGLQAFSQGFAKEGVGAGGCIISAMLRANLDLQQLVRNVEQQYQKIFT